jgi:hypothetical protein
MVHNLNHPSFLAFIDKVNGSILKEITLNSYFSLMQDKKTRIQCNVFKLMKNSVKLRGKLTDTEMKVFLNVLMKKNIDIENYELAQLLTDIIGNFDVVNEMTKPQKRTHKTIKVDKTENG